MRVASARTAFERSSTAPRTTSSAGGSSAPAARTASRRTVSSPSAVAWRSTGDQAHLGGGADDHAALGCVALHERGVERALRLDAAP